MLTPSQDAESGPMPRRMSRAKTKAATNSPSTDWLRRSRKKVRMTRGDSCDEACCSTSMVMLKTSAVKVIMAPEMAESTDLALAASMVNQPESGVGSGSTSKTTIAATAAAIAASPGTNQRRERRVSSRTAEMARMDQG